MTDLVEPAFAGGLWILVFLSALAAYSLRRFSRSRLDEICRSRGHEERFATILKHDDQALLAVELLLFAALLGLIVLATAWLWPPPPALALPLQAAAISDGATWLLEWLLVVLGLLLAALVLPWSIGRVAGERYLDRVWPLLSALLWVLRPYVAVVETFDRLMHRFTGVPEPRDDDPESLAQTFSEEIRTVVDAGQRSGVLESEARTMIHRVMELQDEDVAAIMTPRTEMICISGDATLQEARPLLLESGHSRIPIIGESTDDIIGLLYARDLLQHITDNGPTVKVRDIAREPFYVPETAHIDTLLEMMKLNHVHLAIVIDEYSGVAGLVTLEDVLEEIVGEIADEFDPEEELGIHPVSDTVTEVEARVHLDDLNELFHYDLPEDADFDTIGGFVLDRLGRVPEPGETVTWRNLRITVLAADKRRIDRLRIEVDESLAATAAEEG